MWNKVQSVKGDTPEPQKVVEYLRLVNQFQNELKMIQDRALVLPENRVSTIALSEENHRIIIAMFHEFTDISIDQMKFCMSSWKAALVVLDPPHEGCSGGT